MNCAEDCRLITSIVGIVCTHPRLDELGALALCVRNLPFLTTVIVCPSCCLRRVPAVYLQSAFWAFLAYLALRRMNNLGGLNTTKGFDSPRLHLPSRSAASFGE